MRDVPVDELATYWPAVWGTNAYEWTVPHLKDGMMQKAHANLRLWSGGDGNFELVSLDGDMEATGVTVDYLPPMPPVRGTDAYMKYDDKTFNVFISKGESRNLTIREGTVFISGLDEVDQFTDVRLLIDGPFADQLAYLDNPPLVNVHAN